jgi:hypothetical protein
MVVFVRIYILRGQAAGPFSSTRVQPRGDSVPQVAETRKGERDSCARDSVRQEMHLGVVCGMLPIKHGSREVGPGKAGGPIVASAAMGRVDEYCHTHTYSREFEYSVLSDRLSTSSHFVPGNTTNLIYSLGR